VHVFLVHHGDAVGAEIEPSRPLSPSGHAGVKRLAEDAAARGAKPAVVWHSGKLRAKQTAEAFWRACNPFAEFAATRDLQPEDAPQWIRDRLRGESRDIMLVGHYPHLPSLLTLLLGEDPASFVSFPQHGVVALTRDDDGETWREVWRIA
jgi:phosphohistidine phosphatase